MTTLLSDLKINPENLNQIINKLKTIYGVENVDENRKKQIIDTVNKYGYFPYSHIQALKELTDAETIIALEEKLKLSNTYTQEGFVFDEDSVSPVKRAGFQDSSWMQKEQHNIKLVNLAGLGNGNETKEPGKFIDWLKQLVVLPSGNPEEGILSTTAYLIPFHPREFGCAYIPKHSGVSPGLEDSLLKDILNIKDQVRLFIALTQLAGHPVIYDILPQTGRFSKIILSNPRVARWFDVKDLIKQISAEINKIKEQMKPENHHDSVDFVAEILTKTLSGQNPSLPENLEGLFDAFEEKLLEEKKRLSNLMMTEENQKILSQKAKKLINEALGRSENETIAEENISDDDHGRIIGILISEGLWPAGGGAWCSAGTPVFDKMSGVGGHPTFKHYDYQGNDVTHFANLDCQAPYYFVCLENGKYNEDVVNFFIDFLKKLRKDYNFDGFRVDHIDHIADAVSEKDGVPISYRAPRLVLKRVNDELKKETPYFASLAEYMLWDNLLKEYHDDMGFDVFWGNDIVSQYQKDVARIIEDNTQIEQYNKEGGYTRKLSILKAYNNQDGEFREINQYPGQLGEAGALFKWFKLKFLPGGKNAQRPVLFIDGDESFTKLGIEAAIGAEESMQREDHREFFDKFDAINRFARNNDLLKKGKAVLYLSDNKTGLASWYIEDENSDEKLFIVANEKSPTEVSRIRNGEELNDLTYIENGPINNISVEIPDDFSIVGEYVYNDQIKDFEEKTEVGNLTEHTLYYTIIESSEFHIYKIIKKD